MADKRILTPVKIVDASGLTTPNQLSIVQTADSVSATSGMILVAGSDGANYRVLQTDSGGKLAVNASQLGTWNITNVSGTISLPTGASTEASLAKLTVAQGTALGSNAGPLIQGSVTTGAPTYTTGNINPLSLDTAGNLRVSTGTVAVSQSGTWNITNISGTVSLPTGAATVAKQPALGTAGTASSDVITVQGIASMTPLSVSGSFTDSPTNPASSTQTSAAVAAGSSGTLATGDIKSKYLWGIDISCSVSYKAVVGTVANGSTTSVTVLFGRAGETLQWKPANRKFFQSGNTAGTDGFSCVITNQDTSDAADVYATFYSADN